MSKELEALKIGIPKLKKLYENSAKKMNQNDILGFDLVFVYLDKALQRLEAIDNAKPSEALEDLEMLHDCSTAMQELPSSNWVEYAENEAELDLKLYFGYEHIKQALIKAQEQERVLEILKKHKINIYRILDVESVSQYNEWENDNLVEEEFYLLKRYADGSKS